jgi:hypothetical protein
MNFPFSKAGSGERLTLFASALMAPATRTVVSVERSIISKIRVYIQRMVGMIRIVGTVGTVGKVENVEMQESVEMFRFLAHLRIYMPSRYYRVGTEARSCVLDGAR